MPRTVQQSEILPLDTYEAQRPAIYQRVSFEKARRRIHVGEHLTFLFENAETMRYQVQEMLRIEKRGRPEDIAHEVETYNELLGGPGELGATLLIEIEDAAERDKRLREWLELPQHLYAVLPDGTRVRPRFDERQISHGRLSSVHYLKFELGPKGPVALGCDLPALTCEVQLAPEQVSALQADLEAEV